MLSLRALRDTGARHGNGVSLKTAIDLKRCIDNVDKYAHVLGFNVSSAQYLEDAEKEVLIFDPDGKELASRRPEYGDEFTMAAGRQQQFYNKLNGKMIPSTISNYTAIMKAIDTCQKICGTLSNSQNCRPLPPHTTHNHRPPEIHISAGQQIKPP